MNGSAHLRLGTRASPLALAQSALVKAALEARDYTVEVCTIRTSGDIDRSRPLPEVGGKGLFTRQLDEALLEGRVDLAVHSLKDLPTDMAPELVVAAVPEREDPGDVLVTRGAGAGATSLADLPRRARLGTSSLRRRALALAHRPDLRVDDIRGNVGTRVAKVDSGEFDAIVVAAAGLRRLALWDRVSERLEPTAWLPAPGQGALGLVARSDDADVIGALADLDDPASRAAVRAERTLLAALGGGCRLPIAALAVAFGEGLRLRGLVASPDGRRMVRADATGVRADPEALGREVARELVRRGAREVLGGLDDPASAGRSAW